MEQWNTIDRPEINPCIYSQMIFGNDKMIDSSINSSGETVYPHPKELS
jgi:hypothetical protein